MNTSGGTKARAEVALPGRKFAEDLLLRCQMLPNSGRRFRISRTVEQIDQTQEDWRESNSKLVCMAGLGLTPTEGWKGLPQLKSKICPANPVVLAQIKERYRVERLKTLQVLGKTEEVIKESKMKLFKSSQSSKYNSSVLRNRMSSSFSNISTDSFVPDVVDLVSEDELHSPTKDSKLKTVVIEVAGTATNLRQSPIRKENMRDESIFRWLNATSSSIPAKTQTVEFVDLVSDEEPDKPFILPNYPNISVTVVK